MSRSTAFSTGANHAAHMRPGHVERPERLTTVLDRLHAHDVWNRLVHLQPEAVGLDVAEVVHTPAYLHRLLDAVDSGGAQLDPDTYATGESLDVALSSLGAVLAVTRAVVEGAADNAFAATRPPGHHATPSRAMGFCLLSNVAIAARWAQRSLGVERVLIVDFDVHHGNGTQDIFLDDPSVLFLSVHQHPLYPGTGRVDETGTGAGAGTTLNVPLPAGCGDKTYARAFDDVFSPAVHRFHPDLILVSAGFDAHWLDPLGSMRVTAAGFGRLVRRVLRWADACCDGRAVGVLEGGYHVGALAECVLTTVRLLENRDAALPTHPLGVPPSEIVAADATIAAGAARS